MNTQTGKISPQFHLVLNDWFMSVASAGGDDTFNPTQWQQLLTDSQYQYMFDSDEPVALSDDWLQQDLEVALQQHDQ